MGALVAQGIAQDVRPVGRSTLLPPRQRSETSQVELHRYAIVHSPDGEEMLVEPALAETLEGVWEVAKAKFPGEKLMIVNTDVDDD